MERFHGAYERSDGRVPAHSLTKAESQGVTLITVEREIERSPFRRKLGELNAHTRPNGRNRQAFRMEHF